LIVDSDFYRAQHLRSNRFKIANRHPPKRSSVSEVALKLSTA
jgi:hypothetical protein